MAYNEVQKGVYSFSKFPVIAEFEDKTSFSNTTGTIDIQVGEKETAKNVKVMMWGIDNNLCDRRENLIADNNIIPQLLKTSRNIIMGMDIFCYKEVYDENGNRNNEAVKAPDEVRDFMNDLRESDYWEDLTNDFVKNSMAYVRFLKGSSGKYSIKNIKARYIRPQEMNESGVIENYFRCADWLKKYENEIIPIQTAESAKESGVYPPQFVQRIEDDFLGNEYFPIPVWWTGSKWIEIGNKIPEFHTFNLENQYFTPLHIEIPKGYFYDGLSVKMGKKTENEAVVEEAEKRKTFLDTVDNVLAGTKNAGKAVWSEYSLSQMQKEYGGIKFNELKIPRGDDALLKLFEKTNEANISGTGVHPSLAAIMTSDGLSSGSEIRNALDMYIITQCIQPRKQLLKPLYLLKKLNGWDKELKFAFRDVQLTTTDANPTGSQAVTAN